MPVCGSIAAARMSIPPSVNELQCWPHINCWLPAQFAATVPLMLAPTPLQATKNEDLKLLLSKAEIIDELEATIPKFVERRLPRFYPAYVHVLRVSTGSG